MKQLEHFIKIDKCSKSLSPPPTGRNLRQPNKIVRQQILYSIVRNRSILSAHCKNCGNTKGLKFIEIDNNGNRIHLCKQCLGKRAGEIKHYN